MNILMSSTGRILTSALSGEAKIEHYIEVRSVYDLYRMLKEGVITIDPDIQRGYVWDDLKASLFIDSLYREYPIHMIILAEVGDRKFTVIDGVQRLLTIRRFFDDELRIKKMSIIHRDIRGRKFSELKDSVKRTFTSIAKIPVCFINVKASDDNARILVLCDILRRINIAEQKMTLAQVILCSFKTPTISMVRQLAQLEKYRSMMKFKSGEIRRMLDSYLMFILSCSVHFNKPLNLHGAGVNRNISYVSKFIHAENIDIDMLRSRIVKTIDLAYASGLERRHFTYSYYGFTKVKSSPVSMVLFTQIMYAIHVLNSTVDVSRIEQFYRSMSQSEKIELRYMVEKLGSQEKFEEITRRLIEHLSRR